MFKLFNKIPTVAFVIISLFIVYGAFSFYGTLIKKSDNELYSDWETLNKRTIPSNYHIFVDVEDSKLYLFENGILKKTYP